MRRSPGTKPALRYPLMALLLAIAMLLAACGDDDDPGADDGPDDTDTDTGDDSDDDDSDDSDDSDEINITAETAEEIYAQLAEYPRDVRDAYILERAEEEGVVTIYTRTAVEDMEPKVEAFREKYPNVDAEFVRIEAGNVIDRVRIEHQANQHIVDIIAVSGLEAALMRNEGWMANLYDVPVPEGYPEAAYGEWYAASDFNPSLVAWNTDLASDDEVPPESYDELLEEHWRGRTGLREYAANTVIAMLHTRGEEATREWLQGLIDNDTAVRVGSTPGATLLIAGEYAIHAELLATTFIPRMEDDGAPLDWVHLDPFPSGMTPNHIYAETQHPYAALLWIQHVLSPEGQEFDADNGRLVWNPDVPLKYDAYEELRDAAIDGRILMIDAELVEQYDELADEIITEIVHPHIHPDDR